jgi:hypothetical protein
MSTMSVEQLEWTRELRTVPSVGVPVDAELYNYKVYMAVSEDDKQMFRNRSAFLDEYVKLHRGSPTWVKRLQDAWEQQEACTATLKTQVSTPPATPWLTRLTRYYQGDASLSKGDVRNAYLCYFACTFANTINPVYSAAKAYTALQLQLCIVRLFGELCADMLASAGGMPQNGPRRWP